MRTIERFTSAYGYGPYFNALAHRLRPYAFTYPVIEAALGVAAFLLAAFFYLRTHARS
jgi:hypothetical protein